MPQGVISEQPWHNHTAISSRSWCQQSNSWLGNYNLLEIRAENIQFITNLDHQDNTRPGLDWVTPPWCRQGEFQPGFRDIKGLLRTPSLTHGGSSSWRKKFIKACFWQTHSNSCSFPPTDLKNSCFMQVLVRQCKTPWILLFLHLKTGIIIAAFQHFLWRLSVLQEVWDSGTGESRASFRCLQWEAGTPVPALGSSVCCRGWWAATGESSPWLGELTESLVTGSFIHLCRHQVANRPCRPPALLWG